MWIAKKQQQVKRDGKYVTVYPGDPIPEAATWPSTKSWVDGGFIKWVERTAQEPTKPIAVKTSKAAPTVDVAKLDLSPKSKPKKKGKKKTPTKGDVEKVEE